MSKPVQLHPSRSPARKALAEAITERARIAKVRRDLEAAPFPPRKHGDEDREEKIEKILARGGSLASSFRPEDRERARVEALLRGETPPEDPADVDPRTALREELELIRSESRERRRLVERRRADVSAVSERLDHADAVVRSAASAVMLEEGGRDALIAEYERVAGPAAILLRAIEAASPWVSGSPKPSFDASAARNNALAAAPCPWAIAAERLITDPDAPLPSIEAALAVVGSGSSARNAA
jgi:hypothetical protein